MVKRGEDVSNTTIGIKTADGAFYPILEKGSDKWKRLILTTVKDGQTNAQIDLYEGENITIESAKYVGSLLIENIAPAAAGESEIELDVGIEKDGRLSAKAEDLSSGESQSLSVSLESLTEDAIYDVPEFEFGDDFDPLPDSDTGFQDELSDEMAERYDEEDEGEDAGSAGEYDTAPRRRPLLLAFVIIVGIAAIAALAIFLFSLFEGPRIPLLEARKNSQAVIAAEHAPVLESSTTESRVEAGSSEAVSISQTEAVTHTAARDGPAGAEAAGVSPSTPVESADGVWYSIRRGDTLWDISWNFYRTPWHYGRIAEKNSIRNPDLIFAGTKIFIPEKE